MRWLVALIAALSLAGCGEDDAGARGSPTRTSSPSTTIGQTQVAPTSPTAQRATATVPASNTVTVEYVVRHDGAGLFQVWWYTETGDGGLETGLADDEWRRQVQLPRGAFASVSAMNQQASNASSRVSCELWIDGQLVEESEAYGRLGHVTCSRWVAR